MYLAVYRMRKQARFDLARMEQEGIELEPIATPGRHSEEMEAVGRRNHTTHGPSDARAVQE
jgi:hypothetical protein